MLLLWLLLVLLLACAIEAEVETKPTVAPILVASERPHPTKAPTTAEALIEKANPMIDVPSVCSGAETTDVTALLKEMQSCKADLSENSHDVIQLFVELQEFKTDPKFHRVGFGLCCRFNSWQNRVYSLNDRAGLETVPELGIIPGRLIELGWEYMKSAGRPTEHTERWEAEIKFQAKKTMGLERILPTPTLDLALSSEVVGEWMYEYFEVRSRITIFIEGGQVRIEERYMDGSVGEDPLVASESPMGRRFDSTDGTGEYFTINAQGNLEVWSPLTLITTARKID